MKHFLGIGLILITLLSALLGKGQSDTSTTSTKSESIEVIVLDGDTLFMLSGALGPFSLKERTKRLKKDIADILKSPVMPDSLLAAEINGLPVITYKNAVVLSITPEDAEYYGVNEPELRDRWLDNFREYLMKYQSTDHTNQLIRKFLITAALLVVFFLVLWLIAKFFRWVNQRLTHYENSLKRKRFDFFRYLAPKGPDYFFVFLSNIIRFLVTILFLFLYLPFLFSFLPWTEGLVNKFYGYIANPVEIVINGILDFLPNVFFILVILIITRYVVRVLGYISKEIEREHLHVKGFHKDWAKPTYNLAKIVIYAFSLVFIFPYLPGSNSPAFQGVSIFLGILFSLGSTSAIANIVAGIVITYMRPFMIGDRVKIGDTVGDIVEKTLLVTKVRTVKNEEITIPNSGIINTHLWNFSSGTEKNFKLIISSSVTIGYDIPWTKVNDLMMKAADRTDNVLQEPKPFILQKSLDDYYVNYELNVSIEDPKQMNKTYSELHKNLLEEFNSAEVEILSPQYVVERHDNSSTIYKVDKNIVEKGLDKLKGQSEE